jgi:hypothetical protein
MVRRFAYTFVAAALAAGVFAGCCGKVCQKDPPCRPCENPCCLTPVQKAALGKSTHALNDGPLLYTYEGKTFVLFSEKGRDDFHKDAAAYKERGALRLFKQPGVFYVDVDPGDGYDWSTAKAGATPFTPPPPSAKN